jgi:predicted dehydrogenase
MKKIKENIVKWGVVGVGDVCEVKSAPAMQLIAHSELVAVMRRDGEKARDYADRHKVPLWFDDADQLINHPEVNAIYIATPPAAHAEYTLRAAKAGKPVYVEKPMARSTAECQQMIDACSNAGIPLYVAYYRRRLPHFEKLKSLLEQGAVGETRSVKIELLQSPDPDIVAKGSDWRVDPEIAGGGYFFDLASHQLDYLDYALGPIESVSGFASNQANLYAAADHVQALFQWPGGVMGMGQWCFTVDPKAAKDELVITGSEGLIKMSFFGPPVIYLETSVRSEPEIFQFEMPGHIQHPLIQTVVDDILGQGSCPSTGETAIRTNRIMERITGDYYRGGS